MARLVVSKHVGHERQVPDQLDETHHFPDLWSSEAVEVVEEDHDSRASLLELLSAPAKSHGLNHTTVAWSRISSSTRWSTAVFPVRPSQATAADPDRLTPVTLRV